MPSSPLKFIALSSTLLAAVLGAGAAQAVGPRMLAREVAGNYDMQDGSTLRIDVVDRRVLVENGSAAAHWTAVNSNLLVSPDGRQQIKLMRDFDNTVDRIELRTTPAAERGFAAATSPSPLR